MLEQPGTYVEVAPGVELYVEERGSGMPVVFIPGWTFTTELFEKQMAHFSKKYRAITYDPRSQGRSSKTVEGNDYSTHGKDLAALLKALDAQGAVLVGWSFGCLDAWSYVRHEGVGGLKGVVAVDLSPKPLSTGEGDWVEGPLDEIAGAYNTFLLSIKGQREFVDYYARNVMIQGELSDAQWFWIIEQSLTTPYYVAALKFASGMFSDYREEAKLVDASLPSLSICAEHWAETAVPFMNALCPKTKTAVLGGHMMFWEHAEKFNAIVDEFLQGL